MDIAILREFIALSNTLNFSKTARMMNLSQSTLSNHIIRLEKELGVILINRSHYPSLTDIGGRALEEASLIVNTYDTLLKNCRSYQKNRPDRFTVQTFHYAPQPTVILLERIKEFKQTHQEVSINVRDSLVINFFEDIRRGDADCSYTPPCFREPKSVEGFSYVPLCREEVLLWLDVGSPLYQKKDLTPADLAGYTVPAGIYGAAILEDIYQEMQEVFQIDINVIHRHSDSYEDFFLSKIRRDDVAVFWHGIDRAVSSVRVRRDRALKGFNPPVYTKSYVVFRDNSASPALKLFKEYLSAIYTDDIITT
jgi:DNA-binding transcriptional LysR family regulator